MRQRVSKVLAVDETLDRVDASLERFNETLTEFNATLASFTAALEHFAGVTQRVDAVSTELETVTGRLGPLISGLDVMADPSRLIPERVRRLGRSGPAAMPAAEQLAADEPSD